MKSLQLCAIAILTFVGLLGCVEMYIPPDGNVTVDLSGLPEPCLTGTELVVTIRSSSGGYYPAQVTVTGGTTHIKPYDAPESRGSAAKDFHDGDYVTIDVDFVNLDPNCKSYLENSVFHFPIDPDSTELYGGWKKATSSTSRTWQFDFSTLTKQPQGPPPSGH